MIEHYGAVEQTRCKRDELDIANNAIVLYATGNGPHMNSRPDGAMIPFRGEKGTNREGAFRVAAMVRWLGYRAGKLSARCSLSPVSVGSSQRVGNAVVFRKGLVPYYMVHIDVSNQLPN